VESKEYIDRLRNGEFKPTIARVGVGRWVCRHYDFAREMWLRSSEMLWSQAKAQARDIRRLQIQALKNSECVIGLEMGDSVEVGK
jgi:hypothetical protein